MGTQNETICKDYNQARIWSGQKHLIIAGIIIKNRGYLKMAAGLYFMFIWSITRVLIAKALVLVFFYREQSNAFKGISLNPLS